MHDDVWRLSGGVHSIEQHLRNCAPMPLDSAAGFIDANSGPMRGIGRSFPLAIHVSPITAPVESRATLKLISRCVEPNRSPPMKRNSSSVRPSTSENRLASFDTSVSMLLLLSSYRPVMVSSGMSGVKRFVAAAADEDRGGQLYLRPTAALMRFIIPELSFALIM